MRLDGVRALVIGGGGEGIGRAVSRAYATEGASLAIADVDADRARTATAEFTDAGRRAVAVTGDVRSPAAIAAMVSAPVDAFGGLDVVVTVVGGQVAFVPAVRLHEMTDADWNLVYEMNLRYVARAAAAAIRTFLAQGSGGAIVSIGSVTGFMAAPTQAGYGAAKAGLLSLARTVAAEYARDGIRMNVVAGGAIATSVANADPGDGDTPEIPMNRYGTVADVTAAAVYLASRESAYVTGQQIVVDGGVSVRGPFS